MGTRVVKGGGVGTGVEGGGFVGAGVVGGGFVGAGVVGGVFVGIGAVDGSFVGTGVAATAFEGGVAVTFGCITFGGTVVGFGGASVFAGTPASAGRVGKGTPGEGDWKSLREAPSFAAAPALRTEAQRSRRRTQPTAVITREAIPEAAGGVRQQF